MAVKSKSAGCELDMTPMIDIVFQLIIFFVVTLKLTANVNEDIRLEDGKHGITITPENMPPDVLVIEVDRRGYMTVNNFPVDEDWIRNNINYRRNRVGGDFPILIRADYRAQHDHVKRVMDICTKAGIWKLSFVAVQARAGNKGKTLME